MNYIMFILLALMSVMALVVADSDTREPPFCNPTGPDSCNFGVSMQLVDGAVVFDSVTTHVYDYNCNEIPANPANNCPSGGTTANGYENSFDYCVWWINGPRWEFWTYKDFRYNGIPAQVAITDFVWQPSSSEGFPDDYVFPVTDCYPINDDTAPGGDMWACQVAFPCNAAY